MRNCILLWALLSACVADVSSTTGGDDDGSDTDGGGGKAGGDLGSADTSAGGEGNGMFARVCASGPTTPGIDVSYYESPINWTAVRNSGIRFAFIRVSDGTGFHDPKFASYWTAAKAAGVIRGAYQFFRPNQSITAQADLLINALGGTYTPGDLPPVIDVEVTGSVSPATLAADVRVWVNRVKAALGVDPIVYTGKYFWRDQVGGNTSFVSNSLWIAQYTSLCPDLPAPWATWTFWQNTSTGTVPGISGGLDLDKFNGTPDQLIAYANGTGTTMPPPPPPTTCNSATLDRDVPDGTCVQAASDESWYQCSGGMWVSQSSSAGCSDAYAWCQSGTLGKAVPPRTCVQDSDDSVWYQCDGKMWASPVNRSTDSGPAGACSSDHPL